MTFKHDTQVGGCHYDQGDKPQHWDLAIMYGWDFFQYQITKYVMRWRDKHATPEKKLEDLKKARSFLDKYIANYEAFLQPVNAPAAPQATTPAPAALPASDAPLEPSEQQYTAPALFTGQLGLSLASKLDTATLATGSPPK